MNVKRLSRPGSIMLLAVLMVVPATASMGELQAERLLAQSAAGDGLSSFMVFHGDGDIDPGLLEVVLVADSVTGTEYYKRTPYGPATPSVLGAPSFRIDSPMATENDQRYIDLQESVMELGAAQARFRMSIQPVEGGAPLEIMSEVASLELSSVSDFSYRPDGTDGLVASDLGGEPREQTNYFSPVSVSGAWLLGAADGGRISMRVHGDFILEMERVDLGVDGVPVVQSTVSYEAISRHAGGTEDIAGYMVERFVRVQVTGGLLEFTHPSMTGDFRWLVDETAVQADGPISLVGARGILDGTEYTGDVATLDDVAVEVSPVEGGVHASVQEQSSPATSVSAPLTRDGSTLAIIVVAALLLAGGAAIVLARWLRTPDLREVESALAQGDFQQAAQLSRRILRRRPQDEAVAVARVIALSKADRHDDVIREVEARLERFTPEDGVMEYLLGCSYIQKGAREKAGAFLKAAAKRTPSLQSDVDALLGSKQAPITIPSSTEFGGYA